MSEKREIIYRCGDCGKEWDQNKETCSYCGSTKKCAPFFAEGKVGMRTGLKLGVCNQEGKTSRKVYSRSKLSKHGKETREYLDIDIEGNRKVHHVEEQSEDGAWKTVHDENKPLKKSEK